MDRQPVSRGDLLLLIAVLSVFGIADSTYLTWQWYEAASATWCDLDAFFSCTKVRESPWAAVAGIPTATVGVAGFAILLGLSGAALRGRVTLGPWPTERWLIAFAGIGVAFGAALTVVEVVVVQAVCILCAFAFGLGVVVFGATFPLARESSEAT